MNIIYIFGIIGYICLFLVVIRFMSVLHDTIITLQWLEKKVDKHIEDDNNISD
jgi:hypothetical protein